MLTKDSKLYYWIVLGIYISIFVNSIVFFQKPFEFYIGYLVYIFLLPVFISKFGVSKELFYIFLILLITGISGIYSGSNTSAQFIKIFVGLSLSYFFYFYVVIKLDFGVEQLFIWYLRGAYIVALIGVFQFISFQIGFEQGYDFRWILNKWGFNRGGNFGIRINSILGEPTYFAAVLSSAFFVSIYNIFSKSTFYLSKFQSWVIVVIYVLSFSGLGQAGIFFTFLFITISYGLVRYLLILIPVSIVTYNILYNNVEDFRNRLDGLIALFSGGKFELGVTHGSSFILFNNYQVALKNFSEHPIFGGGLGSHVFAFDKYSIAKYFLVKGFNSNGQDASSMLLRLISETGLFGTGIIIFIIIKCYVRREISNLSYHWIVSNSILIMILLNLFRQGHYFLNGFPFFVILYYFNYISYKNYLDLQKGLNTNLTID